MQGNGSNLDVGQSADADNEGHLNDMNTFLISFLESDEDQLNQVSIRLSINEFIDEIIQTMSVDGSGNLEGVLHECV